MNDFTPDPNQGSDPRAAHPLDPPAKSAGCFSPKVILGCGCGGFLVVAVLIAIMAKVGFDRAFPTEPLDFPPVTATSEEKNALWESVQAKDAAEEVAIRLTPEQVAVLGQAGLDRMIDEGKIGPRSKIRCELAGPKQDRLRILISAEIAESGGWAAGRFLNLDATGHLVVQAGEIEELEVDEYHIGNSLFSGEYLNKQEALEALDTLRQEGQVDGEIWGFTDRIESLRLVDGAVELKLRPQ